jgi:SAM-dependent methyltransferase
VTIPCAHRFERDDAFDDLYPRGTRELSATHWTPLAAARRAATLFTEARARRVLDVGSGVGKFVLAAARAAPAITFFGVEQRGHLVAQARRARAVLGLPNARFIEGDATRTAWGAFDGLYFFNPFGENLLSARDCIDTTVELSRGRFAADTLRAEDALRRAPVGTALVTYNGCGVHIPSSFELSHRETIECSALRLWTKKRETDDGSYFTELYDKVSLSSMRATRPRTGRVSEG